MPKKSRFKLSYYVYPNTPVARVGNPNSVSYASVLLLLFDFFFLLIFFRVLRFSSLKTNVYKFEFDDESKSNGFVSHKSVTRYPPFLFNI